MADNSIAITKDTLFDGHLHCWQEKKGYRFSIDSVLLSHFCLSWKNAEILDIGTGSGILGMILLYRIKKNIRRIKGIEIQKNLVDIANRNIHENGYDNAFTVLHGDFSDFKKILESEQFSHVICNPPFYKKGRGRLSLQHGQQIARHQEEGRLAALMNAIFFSLRNKGETALIYPADMSASLLSCCKDKRLEPKVIRFVYSYPEAEKAKLILLKCRKNGGEGVDILSPLYIYTRRNGEYTDEVQQMYSP